jgi:purine-cytosine permease-like protein
MENHTNPILATLSAGFSVVCWIISFITMNDVQPFITFIAGCLAIISAVFAIRYYHYATKEKKENLKTLNQKS